MCGCLGSGGYAPLSISTKMPVAHPSARKISGLPTKNKKNVIFGREAASFWKLAAAGAMKQEHIHRHTADAEDKSTGNHVCAPFQLDEQLNQPCSLTHVAKDGQAP
jgi:hypothetical protein